jgi:hypothetical protein
MSDEPCWCAKPVTIHVDVAEIEKAERVLEAMKNHLCPQEHLTWIDGVKQKIRYTIKKGSSDE